MANAELKFYDDGGVAMSESPSQAVCLLSGGLDSAVCLALTGQCEALFVDYGQPHLHEEYARAVSLAIERSVRLHTAQIRVPSWRFDSADATMLTPGRNLLLVSLAAALGSPVVMGCNADDYEIYEDCRPEFFEALLPLVEVQTPLISLSKPEIGARARCLGIEDRATWSCYYPCNGDPCGVCGACAGRQRALP